MAKSEYGEVHDDSNVCWSTPLQKKPTGRRAFLSAEVELLETVEWRRFIVSIVTGIMFIMSLPVASCVLVEKPLNEAIMVGSNPVEFKCRSDLGYRLRWSTQQSQSKLILFNGYSISKEATSYCNVENGEPGKFYLNLTATREAAQTYVCVELGSNEESSADLIVIEREAQCEINDNTSHVIITCDHEYSGNWVPELEWSYNGKLIIEGVNAFIVSNKSVSSTLTVPISANDRNYTCTTRFDIGGKPQWTTSVNIPDYVSNSVLTVKANQAFADKPEAQLPATAASETSVGLVIGVILAVAIIIGVIIASIIYVRARRNGYRNEEASDVKEQLATKPQASVENEML